MMKLKLIKLMDMLKLTKLIVDQGLISPLLSPENNTENTENNHIPKD